MKWVDLVQFDAATESGKALVRATFDGTAVRLEGDAAMTARLEKDGVFSVAEQRTVRPADGEVFLTALGEEYRNAYLFATDVREGDTPVPYEAPGMTDAPPEDRP